LSVPQARSTPCSRSGQANHRACWRNPGVFTGQSLSGPADTLPLLRLSDGAYDWESRKVRFPAVGHLQALALNVDGGRLVVSGEAALFSAQVDLWESSSG